jgi:hypothetical protein
LVLPQLTAQLPHLPAYPTLVLLVGEVSAQRATAVVWPIGIDSGAATPENAGPVRGEPGQVAPENLVRIRRIDELDECPRKTKQDLWHALQPTLRPPGTVRPQPTGSVRPRLR